MTDFIDILKNKPLGKGSHKVGDGACVMEKVSILWALHTNQDVSDVFSDLPECTNHVVASTAQAVNDRLNDGDRQKLNAFIPRLLRARRTESDLRINVRLAVWAARRVLHLVRDQDREVCERAIEAAGAWLVGEASAEECCYATDATYAAADAAYAAAAAADAAYAYATDAATDAYAANAANAAYATATAAYAAATGTLTSLQFLDELLDAWEEAVTKEGEDLYVPQSWEDEALAFVSEYMTRG